jgi:hypothetical protein
MLMKLKELSSLLKVAVSAGADIALAATSRLKTGSMLIVANIINKATS